MKKIFTEENEEAIKALLSKPQINILVIDDDTYVQKMLKEVFEEAFPNSSVYCYQGFGVDSDELEFLIQNKSFHIASVDGSLNKWKPHLLFEHRGDKIVEFIKKNQPNTLVISISLEPNKNLLALEKGADIAVDKANMFQFLKEVRDQAK